VFEWHKRFKEDEKVRMQNSQVKTMLTVFFYAKRIIHHEILQEKQTVNGQFYKQVTKIDRWNSSR
jgi:ribosomal protein S20